MYIHIYIYTHVHTYMSASSEVVGAFSHGVTLLKDGRLAAVPAQQTSADGALYFHMYMYIYIYIYIHIERERDR